jgi:hypothetical protein
MATYPKPTNIQPLSIFNTYYYDDSEDGVSVSYLNQNYLKFPQAQGNENLLGVNVSGRAVFNSDVSFNGVATLTTNPASNDNSQRLATTSWTQNLISAKPSTPTSYPQKWLSSLVRKATNNSTNAPSFSLQTIGIKLPIPDNVLSTGENPWSCSVRVLVNVSVFGNLTTSTAVGNIYTGSCELLCNINLRATINNFTGSSLITSQNSGVVANATANPPVAATINHLLLTSTISVWDFVNNTLGRIDLAPLIVTFDRPTATINLAFGTFTLSTNPPLNPVSLDGCKRSIYGFNRSAEILSCTLNNWSNSSNFNNWNSFTFPNANTNTSQNLPAYIIPVSTNSY